MTPKPPPGFEIIPTQNAVPPPPPGFQIVGQGPRDLGIDWSQDDSAVRSAIGALPETERETAYQQWAQAKVAREGVPGGAATRMFNRGIPIVGSLLDEGVAALRSIGEPTYEEALALERERDRVASERTGGVGTALSLAGGLASAPFTPLARGATVAGDIAKGAIQGAGYGAAHAYGMGEGGAGERLENAGTGAGYGAAFGAAIPAVSSALGSAAPAAQNLKTQIQARLPGSITRQSADDVANKVLAGRVQRSGQSADTIEADLLGGERSARLDSNSRATLPETIADTSDDMQRLTGSVYRTGGEASEIVKPALERRQRGPENPYAPRLDDTPQGQIERIVDDFDRALNVKSSKGARATSKELELAQKAKADELYSKAKKASDPFDLDPVNTAWQLQAQQYQGPFRDKLVSAINLFSRPQGSFKRWDVDTVERFDNAKKILDDMIEGSKGEFGKATNLTRELTRYKQDLLAKVHEGGKNKLYQQARDEFGSAAENREAIELGRKAFREDSEVSVDTFRSLTPAQQKLFRIGLRDALRLTMATKKPGDNATLPLQQRRIRELLAEVIPTPKAKAAEFADRPQRFGDLMRREERMSQTRNAVLGNSATAQRQQDDAMFASDALSRIMTSGRSVANVALEAVGAGLQKAFGYRQDVAAALARKLLDTDPQARAQTLAAIRANQQPGAFSAFAEGLDSIVPAGSSFVAPQPQTDRRIGVDGRNELRGDPAQDTLEDLPGVPFGDGDARTPSSAEARAMQQAREADVESRSLLRYGDKQIIPNNLSDAGGMALEGLRRAGEVSAAFPMGILDDALVGVGRAIKGIQNARMPITDVEAAKLAAERQAAQGARQNVRDIGKSMAQALAKRMAGKERAAENAKKGLTPSGVPDTLTQKRDLQHLMKGLPEGTSPAAIKGRQGMPTRDEQIELVEKYIGSGKGVRDLGSGGPWGRSPYQDAREAIQRAYQPQPVPKATRTGPEANLPSVAEIVDAYKKAKDQADMLREQLAAQKQTTSRVATTAKLIRIQEDMIMMQRVIKEAGLEVPKRPLPPAQMGE